MSHVETANRLSLSEAQRQIDAGGEYDAALAELRERCRQRLLDHDNAIIVPRHHRTVMITRHELIDAIADRPEFSEALAVLGQDQLEAGRLLATARQRAIDWLIDEVHDEPLRQAALEGLEEAP